MKHYFLHDGQNQSGPFTLEQLKLMKPSSPTQYWFEGMAEWEDVSSCKELQFLQPPVTPGVKVPQSKPVETGFNSREISNQIDNQTAQLLLAVELFILVLGSWLMITNTLDRGSDERILAGLGSGLVLGFSLTREFRLKTSFSTLHVLLIIAVFFLCFFGAWIFVTNSLDRGSDERILAGLGAALLLSGVYLKDLKSEGKLTGVLNFRTVFLMIIVFLAFSIRSRY